MKIFFKASYVLLWWSLVEKNIKVLIKGDENEKQQMPCTFQTNYRTNLRTVLNDDFTAVYHEISLLTYQNSPTSVIAYNRLYLLHIN